jgi:diguanylate cyclase (GGDEF)-like protein
VLGARILADVKFVHTKKRIGKTGRLPMSLAATLIYWIIVPIWLVVLGTIIIFYIRNPHTFGTTRLLLAVLCIDTSRNIVENIYFGLYFGSRYEVFPPGLAALLGQPILLIIPKILNVIAGTVVLGLLLFRWFPLAVRERGLAQQQTNDLQTLATIDFLTGIYNRRHFDELATAEFARAQRYMRPLSVLILDIDHFKTINDRLGHAAGDAVLQRVAVLCSSEKRESDILARIGGEEFAILLPETTQSAAVQLAERLRSQICDSTTTILGEKVKVTVSIGVAGSSVGMAGIQALIRRADQALYVAKTSGRNKVELSSELDVRIGAAAE